MENRAKECQLDLFAGRASAASMHANQLRPWFAAMVYVLLCALRRIGLRLLKIGALIRISVRRFKLAMASAHPYQAELAHVRLAAAMAP